MTNGNRKVFSVAEYNVDQHTYLLFSAGGMLYPPLQWCPCLRRPVHGVLPARMYAAAAQLQEFLCSSCEGFGNATTACHLIFNALNETASLLGTELHKKPLQFLKTK